MQARVGIAAPHNPKVLSNDDLAAAAAYEVALTIASGIQEGAGND